MHHHCYHVLILVSKKVLEWQEQPMTISLHPHQSHRRTSDNVRIIRDVLLPIIGAKLFLTEHYKKQNNNKCTLSNHRGRKISQNKRYRVILGSFSRFIVFAGTYVGMSALDILLYIKKITRMNQTENTNYEQSYFERWRELLWLSNFIPSMHQSTSSLILLRQKED